MKERMNELNEPQPKLMSRLNRQAKHAKPNVMNEGRHLMKLFFVK